MAAQRSSNSQGAAQGMSLAFEFAGAVFMFWFLGRLVDNWLNIEPWGQVVGALLGWVGGFLHVYYATRPEANRFEVPPRTTTRETER